ncbi:MAG TPA: acyclic terpene utilization AtuA family protein [Jatrophihabitans sp.]|nr:acyclic terpene utilization AtuA family protein [Jatrophihabitans sp.]
MTPGIRTAPLRIGCGAGFAGDRLGPAVDLVREGRLDYLILECLGERTIALGQLRRTRDPRAGYDALLERRARALLPEIVATGTRLVTNFGSANPVAAGHRLVEIADELGISGAVSVAVVTGDDVFAQLDVSAPAWEDGVALDQHGELVSAHAYIGADALLPALESGANVIVAGRVADPSLCLAPLVHEFGWQLDDWDALARGTLVGHLMECAGQLTGGYYADLPLKPVPGLDNLGYPIAAVTATGEATLTKLTGTGGVVDRHTAIEQLLYEVTDPRAYLTPDVTLDFTDIEIDEVGPDAVQVRGAAGRPRPDSLKVSVGYRAGFRSEGEISYAGRGAVGRARLAGDLVRSWIGDEVEEFRVDLVGVSSIHGEELARRYQPYECRLRVAAIANSAELAEVVADAVTALYTNGPAGGGGLRTRTDEVIGVLSTTIPRADVELDFMELGGAA